MDNIIKETIQKQKEIYEKFKNDINNLPFFKQLITGEKYIIIYNDYSTKNDKKIYCIYEGAQTLGGLINCIPEIKYAPLKKNLTTYEGRRGATQSLPIKYIKSIKKINEEK